MNKFNRFAPLTLLTLVLALGATGCMSGNAKRFFAENKSYKFIKPTISFSTPFGTEVISAEEISSQVAYQPGETNPIPPQPLVVPSNGTIIIGK